MDAVAMFTIMFLAVFCGILAAWIVRAAFKEIVYFSISLMRKGFNLVVEKIKQRRVNQSSAQAAEAVGRG